MAQQHEKEMTLEQIEAHIERANLQQYDRPQAESMAATASLDLSGKLQQVCGIYQVVKPVLQIIANFPLLPASIKRAVKTFMNVMNTVCPA